MSPSRPWFAASLTAIALTGVAALALGHLRADALATQRQQISALSQAVTDETDRGLQGAEQGLAAMRAELQDGRLPAEGAEAARALQTRVELMPLVETLWLVDDAWNPIAASDASPLPSMAAFAAAPRAPDSPGRAGMVIGQPAPTGASGQARVILARRFGAPPGQPSGWILAALRDSALLGTYAASAPVRGTQVAIFRADGVRLAGRLEDARGPAEPFSALRLTALHEDQIHRFLDGSERLVGMHDAPHYEITVVLTRDVDAVLDGWRTSARAATAGLAVLIAIGFGVLLAWRRRTGAR